MLIQPYFWLSIGAFLLADIFAPTAANTGGIKEIQPISGIVDQFMQLPSQPMPIPLKRDIEFDESGGHIQGIQLHRKNGEYSAFLTGSSKEVAYVAQVKLGTEAQVLSIDTLMLSPYRHAGGFQVHDQFLAVGIEDNQQRTTSKVVIYDVGNGKNWKNPNYVLERNGPYELSTAGAVGITRFEEDIILVVADWNARNLDFYSCPVMSFERKDGHFAQIGRLEMAAMQKQSWSDSLWHSYQNINLIANASGLYAMAFGRDLLENHVADLFAIRMDNSSQDQFISPVETSSQNATSIQTDIHAFFAKNISLKKIATRQFQCEGRADFRAGAGIFHSGSSLILAAAPYYMDNDSAINLFTFPPDLTNPKSNNRMDD